MRPCMYPRVRGWKSNSYTTLNTAGVACLRSRSRPAGEGAGGMVGPRGRGAGASYVSARRRASGASPQAGPRLPVAWAGAAAYPDFGDRLVLTLLGVPMTPTPDRDPGPA